MRLPSCDLETLGIYLFGPRWQCPLARAIHRDDRLVRRWVADDRQVSVAAARLIEKLTRDKHGNQMRRVRASYLNMIASLTETETRAHLLAMDLGALRLDDQLRQTAMASASAIVFPAAVTPAPLFGPGAGSGFAAAACPVPFCALRATRSASSTA